MQATTANGLTRRSLLVAGLASVLLPPQARAGAGEEAIVLIEQLIGHALTPSDRVRLDLPAVFPNGYTVPMTLEVDSPMTDREHVRQVRAFAPKNPIVEIVGFRFAPQHSAARVSTRIRLAAPQFVVAVAEMNDGAFLMAKTWVDVATNGCV